MMEIKSSALNISLAGTHTFDQFLDYYFKVGLRDLLASKAKKKKENQEFSEYEEKEKQINLFIHVKGPIDNLKFMYDRKGFKDQLKQEISNEKNTVKALLKQEFGLFKNDTSIKSLNKKNLPPIEIEWEENKQPSSVISEPANKKKLEVESPPNSPQKESQNKTLKKLLKQPTKTETEEDIN
ncbi:MAG: hypothetical protein IT239_03400 [Bacteroidia bacterium]|nr:hypothetical protein [Bacteroidia bacterium]